MDHSLHHHMHHMPAVAEAMNPYDLMGFIAIFSFSFAASLHCAFMCSPLVCAALGERAKLNGPAIWLYNLGRVLSYSLAGGLAAWWGQWLVDRVPFLGSALAKVLGVMILLVALSKLLAIFGIKLGSVIKFSRWGLWLNRLMKRLSALPYGSGDFLLGFCTVLLPCMTLSPAISAAAATFDPLKGSLYMLAFALGTLPIMLGATYVPWLFYRRIPERLGQSMAVLFLLVLGIITFIR